GCERASPLKRGKCSWAPVRHLETDEFVSAHATDSAFLDGMVAYPGGIIQDTVHHLWAENCVANDRLPMKAQHSFRSVNSNILFINGRGDTIVLPQCTEPRSEEHTSELQSRFDLV